MDDRLFEEFRFDWVLAGKAPRTVDGYITYLRSMVASGAHGSLSEAKKWVNRAQGAPTRRKRAQAIRAFGVWAEQSNISLCHWWRKVPLGIELQQPQDTVTQEQFEAALASVTSPRDRALILMLWTTGMRRSEIANVTVGDVDTSGGFIVVRNTKTRVPRVVPIAPQLRKALRPLLGRSSGSLLLGMSSNAIRLYLARRTLPSAHAWRRGWAVAALKSGVSETSVRSVAGWSSGAMVARYTRKLSGEVAMAEFLARWSG
jgi:integrase